MKSSRTTDSDYEGFQVAGCSQTDSTPLGGAECGELPSIQVRKRGDSAETEIRSA